MKHAMYAVVAALVIALLAFILISVQNKDVRNDEASNALATAVDTAVEELMDDNEFEVTNNKQMVYALTESIASAIDSNADVCINVLDVDYEKGIMDIEVIEQYKNSQGKYSTTAYTKTIVFDREYEQNADEKYVVYRLFLTEEDLNNYLSAAAGDKDTYVYKELKGRDITIYEDGTTNIESITMPTVDASELPVTAGEKETVKNWIRYDDANAPTTTKAAAGSSTNLYYYTASDGSARTPYEATTDAEKADTALVHYVNYVAEMGK